MPSQKPAFFQWLQKCFRSLQGCGVGGSTGPPGMAVVVSEVGGFVVTDVVDAAERVVLRA